MANSAELGITISCFQGDVPLLKGCLSSLRAHLGPDMPICLIKHGKFNTRRLEDTYDLDVLNEDLIDQRLRANSYGYGLTKMVAFWHAPYERFVHVDADTVCWGNFLDGLEYSDVDVIFNEPHELITEYIQLSQYFNPDLVFDTYPRFDWQKRPYFNTGVFIARRGILDLEEYLELIEFQRRNPKALLSGEQGILNFMIFRRIAAGEISARQWPFQAIVPVIEVEELMRRFSFLGGRPMIVEGDRRIIHWAGRKPYLARHGGRFHLPMTHYRIKYLEDVGSSMAILGTYGLVVEEIMAQVRLTVKRRLRLRAVSKYLRAPH